MIIASVGINSLTDDKVTKIILSGANILRYNFAYRDFNETIKHIKRAQEIIDDLNSSVKILVDLPLKKIRLGDFDLKTFAVHENDEVIFRSAPFSPDCNEFIPVQIPKLGDAVYINQTVTLGDGEVAIQIIEIINHDTVKAKILNNGIIFFKKSFNIGHFLEDSSLLNNYQKILHGINDLPVDYIAYSHINTNFDNQVKEIIAGQSQQKQIILKLEHDIAKTDLDEICGDLDYRYILIDRGEIGVNLPFEQVGVLQKNICETASRYQKNVIVSTQILESTSNNYIPQRSEILDITNMVIDGVSGMMLCHETAFGSRPAYSIATIKKIIVETEKYIYSLKANNL